MKNKQTGANVLVCGSQKFDDESFVFCALDTFYTQTNRGIRRIYTSKFSGACEYARLWAERVNSTLSPNEQIQVLDYAFDMILEQKNQSFYEDSEIPAFAIANDPFFIKGKEELMSKNVNLVVCFPNQEGKLGASTHNIQRFANLAEIPVFDCSQLMSLVKQYKEEVSLNNQNDENLNKNVGFNNRHPGKR